MKGSEDGARPAVGTGYVAAALVLTCEHASAAVPKKYEGAFANPRARAVLSTHRGSDLGALRLAKKLQRACRAPLVCGKMTRLLIDLNRSPGHRALYSEWSSRLPADDRGALLALHRDHWCRVEEAIVERLRVRRSAVHVGVHSFTKELGREVRTYDVGILYDPSRSREVRLAGQLREAMRELGLVVRRNAPYRGVADGLTTHLRRRFPEERYIGLELEFNQARFASPGLGEAEMVRALAAVLGPAR